MELYTPFWYTVTGPPLTSVSVSTSPDGPQQADTTITLAANATGGTNVQYQFWVYNPSAVPSWQQLQAYSPQDTCLWTPTMPGSYLLAITAMDSGPARS